MRLPELPREIPALASAPPTIPAAAGAPASDSAIVRQVLEGQADGFAVLMRRHGSRVQSVVRRHVPADQMEEMVQDTFVRAYHSLPTFQLDTQFGDWLTGIAVRTCYDYWRRHYRNRELAASTLGDRHRDWAERAAMAQSSEEFEAQARRKETHEVLQYALDRLSAEDRLVVSLVHLEGLSIEQAAQQLGWSQVNVKVRAHRARRKMRKELEALLGPLREGSWQLKTHE
ncbi:MAG TPA: sigma-70 family RNA polymerase sigma factor [bacterium]|nr:sigma-70 family RNA polymerase sigma factor [bacterium]